MSLIKTKVVDEPLLLEGLHTHANRKNDESAEYKLDESNDIINLIPTATSLILSFKNIEIFALLVNRSKLVG